MAVTWGTAPDSWKRDTVCEMTEKESLFAEIYILVQEQITTLQAELLTPVEFHRYAQREKLIKALEQRIVESPPRLKLGAIQRALC